MATRHIAHIIDDLDGTVLQEGEGKQVTFSIEGRVYEIDLSERNAEKFYAALAPYVDAARRSNPGDQRRSRKRSPRTGGDVDLNAVRAWARENGHTVSDRGRVSSTILEAYSALS